MGTKAPDATAGPGIWRRVGGRLSGRVGPVVAFSLLTRILALVLVAPLSAAVLRLFLARWGRYSVGNFEIAEFFLSAPGMLALIVVGSIQLAALLLEQAGLVFLLVDRSLTPRGALARLIGVAPRVLRLAVLKLLRYLLIAAPFLAGVFLAVKTLWAGRDLNGLIVLKPPVFWIGAAIGGVLLIACVALIARFLLGWILALPILLFEPGTTPRQALKTSTERSRGRLRRTAGLFLVWAAVSGAVGTAAAMGLTAAAGAVLGRLSASLPAILAATAGVLFVHTAVGIALSAIASTALAGLVLELHGDAGGARPEPASPTGAAPAPTSASRGRLWAALAVLVVVSIAGTWLLFQGDRPGDGVEITAHRAGATVAPENTLAALRLAVEHGAEWAEIDVQRTADGAVVVLHDADLARLGRIGRKVLEASLAEIREIDVGAALDPRFPGEKVPTLDEFLAAAAGKIRLNIELKPAGKDEVRPLTLAVVEAVRAAGLADRTRICSQSYEAIRLAKETEPRLEIGFIAGAAVGDLTDLDVDFLMVNAGLATRKLVRRAAAKGVGVHPWTVNEPALLLPLVDRGVANVITDDVVALRARLLEIRDLDLARRLLLRARNYFAD